MRVAILARVSSSEQVDGHSIPGQLASMRARCAREGWEIVREFVAEGESAFTNDITKRPTLLAAVEGAERREFDALLVHESSRFARNEEVAQAILERLMAAGVQLVNGDSQIDYSTPEGRMFFGIESNLNAYWSRKMGAHIRKGYKQKFEEGGFVGSRVPFGYRLSDSGILAPVPEEAVAIQKAYVDRARGKGFGAIADEWNAVGLEPRSWKARQTFFPSTVRTIIQNPIYRGLVRHGKELRKGLHEPIVTEDAWMSATALVKPGYRKPKRAAHALLTGMIRCSGCGGPIWTGGNGRTYYYQERANERREQCPNMRSSCQVAEIDSQVAAIMRALTIGEEWLTFMNEQAKATIPVDHEVRRGRLTERRRRLVEMYLEQNISKARYQQEKTAIDTELASMDDAEAPAPKVYEELQSFMQLWDAMSLDQRSELCRMVLHGAVLDTKTREVAVEPKQGFKWLFALRATFAKGSEGAGTSRYHAAHYRLSDLERAA